MPTLRTAGLAGLLVATALVGGTIIGSVAASTVPRTSGGAGPVPAAAASPDPARAAAVAEYCAAFRKAFASALGVDESALAPAAKSAAIATIDGAVTEGKLPQAAADRLKARIEAAAGDGCALLAGRVGRIAAAAGRPAAGGAGAALGVVKDGLTAAATALGVTPAELGADLRGGKTLKTVATDKNVPYDKVTTAVLGAVKADLDKAVTAGTIRQARADRVLARLQQSLADGRLRPAAPVAPGGSAAPSSGG